MHLPFFRPAALLTAAVLATSALPAHAQIEPYIGQMMLFAPPFAQGRGCPRNYLPADGRLLSIPQNSVLYALLRTTYGGDGVNTFALPDMRGRVPVGVNAGPGLTPLAIGQIGGSEDVTLIASQLPPHLHAVPTSPLPATHASPGSGRIPAQAQNAGVYGASDAATNVTTYTGTNFPAGGTPVPVRDPYLAMNWCIAVNGYFPSSPD